MLELASKLPVTVRLSSTVTVPPAESIVRLPLVVSISLSPVTPICILSIVAPPLASRAPVKVVCPVTPSVPAIVVLPLDAVTLNLLVLISKLR